MKSPRTLALLALTRACDRIIQRTPRSWLGFWLNEKARLVLRYIASLRNDGYKQGR